MRITSIGIIAVALLAFTGAANAELALDFTPPESSGTNASWSLGWTFVVNTTITVTSLEYWDGPITQNHDVGIYDSSGNLLTSATITPSDPLVGSAPWREETITPITLTAGQTYVIMGETGTDIYAWDPASYSTIPQITYGEAAYNLSNTLAFPNIYDDKVVGGFGPSFNIPEPSFFGYLLAFGAIGLGALGRARMRASRG